MKTWLMAGVALMALSGCGGSQDAVGENSAGSIKTTAVGEVVGNIASPTADNATTPDNSTDAVATPDGASEVNSSFVVDSSADNATQ